MPEFSTVTLNGMECLRAFDIYARLWEDISPVREKTTSGEAVARLEWLFAGKVTEAKKEVDMAKTPRDHG